LDSNKQHFFSDLSPSALAKEDWKLVSTSSWRWLMIPDFSFADAWYKFEAFLVDQGRGVMNIADLQKFRFLPSAHHGKLS